MQTTLQSPNCFGIHLRKQSIFLMLLLMLSKLSFSQLITDVTATAPQLVNTIVGPGYAVSNIKLNCGEKAIATFTGTSNIGFEKGILLTTGMASIANGPNNRINAGYNHEKAGDLQLDSLLGIDTYDGCALEFDLVPPSDTLKINYVLGSEEYPEYVNKQFNDAFGFFVSGPGITGSKNIATLPGSTIPVSINSINAVTNNQYFVDNTNGTTIQYDGFTKPLTAVQAVTPFSTYHLKIVIADVSDAIYDSGVFIELGSIRSSPVGKDAERCGAGIVNLSATTSGGTLNWYTESAGGNSIYTGSNYAVNLTETTTFYVENTKTSNIRTPVTGVINPGIAKPLITENGGILSAPAGYSYQWYCNSSLLAGEANQTYSPTKTGNYMVAVSNAKNCSATSDVISFTLGIKPTSLDALVQIFPNPANEIIYIQAPLNGNKNLTISIYSIIGKLIYQETYVNSNQTHLLNTGVIEANGIYFIKLQSGTETITRKININH